MSKINYPVHCFQVSPNGHIQERYIFNLPTSRLDSHEIDYKNGFFYEVICGFVKEYHISRQAAIKEALDNIADLIQDAELRRKELRNNIIPSTI